MSYPPILINSCDAYLDVLEIQLEILKKNGFIGESKFDVFINTETKIIKSLEKNIIFHKNGNNEWGERFIASLKKIDSDYVFILYDDYYPECEFNREKFFNLLDILQLEDWDCCYLTPVIKPTKGDIFLKDGVFKINKNRPFKLNTTAAIWKKNSLLSVFYKGDDPWSWEAFGGYRKSAKQLKIFSISKFSSFQYKFSHHTGGSIYRGGWVESVLVDTGYIFDQRVKSSKRTIYQNLVPIKRDLSWKLKFLIKGLSISIYGTLHFLIYSIKKKLSS